ncbi:SH3 domain-containing protein [Streptomyces sp. C]|uniref:SH3 domain-containing protein n=1 Tax=Streptomyces sp. C TaxID=253839 RepID=UPI0001B57DA5|nr:SH3 domain-containing protein [Streptomyces sp. C]
MMMSTRLARLAAVAVGAAALLGTVPAVAAAPAPALAIGRPGLDEVCRVRFKEDAKPLGYGHRLGMPDGAPLSYFVDDDFVAEPAGACVAEATLKAQGWFVRKTATDPDDEQVVYWEPAKKKDAGAVYKGFYSVTLAGKPGYILDAEDLEGVPVPVPPVPPTCVGELNTFPNLYGWNPETGRMATLGGGGLVKGDCLVEIMDTVSGDFKQEEGPVGSVASSNFVKSSYGTHRDWTRIKTWKGTEGYVSNDAINVYPAPRPCTTCDTD